MQGCQMFLLLFFLQHPGRLHLLGTPSVFVDNYGITPDLVSPLSLLSWP